MPTASVSFTESSTGASVTIPITYQDAGGVPRIEMSGSQTYPVDLAMMPAAGTKVLIVWVDAHDAAGGIPTAPLTVTWTSNAVSKSQPIGPGSALLIADPSPVHGPTALSLVSTVSCVAHVAALG